MSTVDILSSLVAGASGAALVSFLGRSLLSSLLTKDVERFKSSLVRDVEQYKAELTKDLERFRAELQVQHAVELERLRADLRVMASERETRFSRLHERRIEIIAELYGLAWDTWRTHRQMLPTPERYDDEALDRAWAAANSLYFQLDKQRIWLPVDVREALDSVARTMTKAYFRARRAGPENPLLASREQVMREADDLVFAALNDLRTVVEERVRTMLDGESPASISPTPVSPIENEQA